MKEIFKTIEDYPDYEISNHGRVRSNKRKNSIILKQKITKTDYRCVRLYNDTQKNWFTVHKLVWLYFGSSTIDKLQIDHIDNNKSNNRIDNLQLLTQRNNSIKGKKHSVNKTSKYPGVSLRENGKYRSQIQYKGNKISLGSFIDEDYAYAHYHLAKIIIELSN